MPYVRGPRPYRKKTSEQMARANLAKSQRNRAMIDAAKDQPCMDCGVKYPVYVMDLDHRPDEVKSFQLSQALRKSCGAVADEIAKCDAVCANCHRIRTHTRENAYLPPYLLKLRAEGKRGTNLGREAIQ